MEINISYCIFIRSALYEISLLFFEVFWFTVAPHAVEHLCWVTSENSCRQWSIRWAHRRAGWIGSGSTMWWGLPSPAFGRSAVRYSCVVHRRNPKMLWNVAAGRRRHQSVQGEIRVDLDKSVDRSELHAQEWISWCRALAILYPPGNPYHVFRSPRRQHAAGWPMRDTCEGFLKGKNEFN